MQIMKVLDLPLELFREILRQAITARGTKRGLRLRLVNKAFATEIFEVLAQFKLLDTAFVGSWDRPPPSMAIAYLERRILNAGPSGAPHLVWIRSVANQLSQETQDGRDEYDYIRQLCPLVLGSPRWKSGNATVYENIDPVPRPSCHRLECVNRGFCDNHILDDDVFITALYTQTLAVAARWLSSGKRGRDLYVHSHIFGFAVDHAITHGNQDVLVAALDQEPDICSLQYARSSMLRKVTRFGNMDLTRLIWDFKAVQYPWVFGRERRPSHLCENRRALIMLNTPNREIFNWIMEKRRIHLPEKKFDENDFSDFLCESADQGWVDMTACYLELGALVDGVYGPKIGYRGKRPLLKAAINGHKEVVKVLLNHGADTSQPVLESAVKYGHFDVFYLLLEHGAETGEALTVAVTKGYRSIVDALLERGGHTKEHLQSLLPRAIEAESKEIFQTLVKHVEVDEATRTACVKVVEENGLESMAELL